MSEKRQPTSDSGNSNEAQPPSLFTGTGSDRPTPRTKTMGMFGYIPDAFTSKSLQFDGDTTPRHRPAAGGTAARGDVTELTSGAAVPTSSQSKPVKVNGTQEGKAEFAENGDVTEKMEQSSSDAFLGFNPVSVRYHSLQLNPHLISR